MKQHDELKRFFEEVSSNEELKQHFTGHKTIEGFCKEVVEQGRKQGYDFSEEEVRQAIAIQSNQELQDEELDRIAGADAAKEAYSTVSPLVLGPLGVVTCD